MLRAYRAFLSGVLILASALGAGSAAPVNDVVESFDGIEPGRLPSGWRVDATNPGGALARWEIAATADAASAPNVLALTEVRDKSSGVYNLCWNPNAAFKDGQVEVRVQARTGATDQGGGPIWRVRDADNYYVARYNPLERNFRVYYVEDGRRRELAGVGDLDIGAGRWFTIRVVHVGAHITGWLDDKKLLEVDDSHFPDAGGVGVWTKADAATWFDDLRITYGD